MRNFDYRKLKEYQWDSEVLGLVAQIHEFKGRQELYLHHLHRMKHRMQSRKCVRVSTMLLIPVKWIH